MRQLPYPLYLTSSNRVDTPEDEDVRGIPVFPEDPDERIRVFFDLSWHEFVQLATAVDVGSDIAYGVDGLKVWWIWVRSLNDMQICEAIIDCLTNDEDTRNAFSDFVSNQIQNNTWLLKQLKDLSEARVVPTATRCEDGLFAIIRQTIGYADTHTRDWLQKVEDSRVANLNEAITGMASFFGTSSGAGVSILETFINWIADNLLDAYPSVSTEELLDAVACEIFCELKDGCTVSIDDFYNFFKARVEAEYPTDFASIWTYLGTIIDVVTGDGGRFVFDVMMSNFFTAIRLSNYILDGTVGGMYTFNAKFRSFQNDSNADWEFLCDCGVTYAWQVAYGASITSDDGATIIFEYGTGGGIEYKPDGSMGVDVTSITTTGYTGIDIYGVSGLLYAGASTGISLPYSGVTAIYIYNNVTLTVEYAPV